MERREGRYHGWDIKAREEGSRTALDNEIESLSCKDRTVLVNQ